MDAVVGIIANPVSGRDIRRLVARASVFPNSEKAYMAERLIRAAGALGVRKVLMSTDTFGVAAAVLRARTRAGGTWPEVEFCELGEPTGTAEDTRAFVRLMRAGGAGVIVALGGDGTMRAAAAELGDTPLVPLSTGTNNVFPQVGEATVAGIAAALVATGRVAAGSARTKMLHVECGARRETALVDVCVSTLTDVGARALWRPDSLRELYCAFAEPHAIGLSSVAGLLRPTGRDDTGGVAVRLAGPGPAPRHVVAPLAPGVLGRVGVLEVSGLPAGERRVTGVPSGTVALDGEREFEYGPAAPVTVTLRRDGPLVVDVPRVLATAAELDLLTIPAATPATGRSVR